MSNKFIIKSNIKSVFYVCSDNVINEITKFMNNGFVLSNKFNCIIKYNFTLSDLSKIIKIDKKDLMNIDKNLSDNICYYIYDSNNYEFNIVIIRILINIYSALFKDLNLNENWLIEIGDKIIKYVENKFYNINELIIEGNIIDENNLNEIFE